MVDHIDDAGFYVSFNDGELVLNMKSQDGHKYYHQVKGNLTMTGRKVFNFCMWTLQGMTTEKLGTSQSQIHDHSTGLNVHCESKKNCATFIFTVTMANVGRFLKFFQCRNQKEMAHNKNEKFPTVA